MLEALFHPRTVAVIGASTDPRKFGGQPVHDSLMRGFEGTIYPVNPSAEVVQGLRSYPDLAAVEGPVDCAVISVPVPALEDAVSACAAKGVKVATIFTAGLAETGPDGRRLQDRLAAIARGSGLRLVGPNCMGALCLKSGFIATFTSAFRHDAGAGWPEEGGVSIASQSGAVGVHMMVLVRDRGLGLAKWVTTGNQCDVEVADCIAYFAEDAETTTILAYIEGCRDAAALGRALDAARARGKPVLVLKVGRTPAGAAAARAHTDSESGDDRAFDALIRRHHAYRASTLTELVDVAAAAVHAPLPSGPAVGLVTTSGGVGALMADAATRLGLSVAGPPDRLRSELVRLAPLGAAGNPFDTGAAGMRDMAFLLAWIETVLACGAYPSVIAFIAHLCRIAEQRAALTGPLAALRARFPDRVLALAGSMPADARRALERAGILVYDEPAAAVAAVAALAGIAAARAGPRPVPITQGRP